MRRRGNPGRLPETVLTLCLGFLLGLVFSGCGDGASYTGGKPELFGQTRASLTGYVTDRRDGRVLSGVQVRLELGTWEASVLTGLDGAYSFEDVPPGSYQLTAFLASHQLSRTRVLLQDVVHEQRTLSLVPVENRGAAEVEVVDSSTGAVLPGTEVLALDLGSRSVTGATGKALFPNLPQGEVRFELTLAGYRTARVFLQIRAGQLTTPKVVLRRIGGTLEGRLTSAATTFPLTGALVSLPGMDMETYTASDGRYRLLDVPDSPALDVIFSEVSHSPTLRTTAIVASRVTTLDAVLEFGFGLVQGTVRSVGGAPVAAAVVAIPEFKLTTTTDLTGAYRFDQVPADPRVSIGAGAAGFAADSALIVVPPNGFVIQDFSLQSMTGSISGTLVQTGTTLPVPSASVTIRNLFASTSSNSSGVFAFSNVPAQVHLLEIQATGYSPRTTAIEVLPGVTMNPVIHMVPLDNGLGTGSLSGKVTRSSDGAAVTNALVSLPATRRTTRTDSSGNYFMADLEALGSAQIIVNAAGYQDLTTTTTLIRDRVNVEDLVLTPIP